MILKAVPAAKYEIIREMTSRDDNLLNIRWLCEIAGVSRSGYYYWLGEESARQDRERQDERDFELVLEAYKYRGYDKGVRGIHMRLLHQAPPVVMNPKKIRRLMQKYNLKCPIRRANPYRRMAKAMQTNRVAPNLLAREFRAHGSRRVLLTDITYISRRGDDKYTYLSVIMDAYTKQILAYVLSTSLEVDFVLETVQMLLKNYGSELETDALVHSDQGCHYTSVSFRQLLSDSALRQSMSRRANCWDNRGSHEIHRFRGVGSAPQESLFGHMKDEIHIRPNSDFHHDVVKKVNDWVDYYNNERYQWGLSKLSPNEFYTYTKTGVYPLPGNPPTTTERSETDDAD